MTILFHSALFILTPQDYPLLTACFCLELTNHQGIVFVGPKVWSVMTDLIKSSATFIFKTQFQKHPLA